uniref:Uncharacterized protein n=1 Tax=Magnetococcus massalia (strain MO-1) TaxID=451514 RepID=A0A1S7LIN0_MAGMO|nr:protein of unknown function [Candidatus Magnetococcus massalia]
MNCTHGSTLHLRGPRSRPSMELVAPYRYKSIHMELYEALFGILGRGFNLFSLLAVFFLMQTGSLNPSHGELETVIAD